MSRIYETFFRPALFGLSPETAHEIGIASLKLSLGSRAARRAAERRFVTSPFGEIERFGLKFKNPLGMAAGFDKNGIVIDQLAALGFGFVETGTITLEAQPGNEKPRMFRLPEDKALINRLGFNNEGAAKLAERIKACEHRCVVGVNIGKNKEIPIDEAVENYLRCFDIAREAADYVAVNISSPNTPNLRELQKAENFEELIGALQRRNRELSEGSPKPLLVKIAPDLTEAEIEQITDICLRFDIDGVIATNTTVERDGLLSKTARSVGPGGLSGRPLAARSNRVISSICRYSKGRLPIIGVGGIFTAEDAFDKIKAGACLLQAYTGFVYKGVTFARDVNSGLAELIAREGFASLDEAVGSGVK